MGKIWVWIASAACLLTGIPAFAGAGDVAELLPVLHSATQPGAWHTESAGAAPVASRFVDGDISDWKGTPSGYAGTSIYSAGEFIYSDHLFDAYGPDDGTDAQRVATLGPAADAIPQTYRVEPLASSRRTG